MASKRKAPSSQGPNSEYCEFLLGNIRIFKSTKPSKDILT